MTIPPKYQLSPSLNSLLLNIESFRNLDLGKNIPKEISENLRRQSILGSSLFSARIEGNSLTRDEVSFVNIDLRDKRKMEVANIYRALNYVYSNYKNKTRLTIEDLILWHRLVLKGISAEGGNLRLEMGGIFDAFGNVVYVSTPPAKIRSYLTNLVDYVNSDIDNEAIPLKACLCHYLFEKIHPFIDGNGRVGRLILSYILNKYGYTANGFLVLEDYLDSHRNQYYGALDVSESKISIYLEFMLKAIYTQLDKVKELYLVNDNFLNKTDLVLLPRRLEILNIVREHKMVNFDFIQRRFFSINARTLRYDLKKLVDGKFIIKRGETRGVFYSPRD